MAPGDHAPPPKRKRGPDTGPGRPSPALRGAAAAAAQAAQQVSAPLDSYDDDTHRAIREHLAPYSSDLHNGHPSVTETAQAALTHYSVPASFETGPSPGVQADHNGPFSSIEQGFADQLKEASQNPHTPQQGTPLAPSSTPKPPVGSDEWHRIRRDNHKEGKPQVF